MPLPDNLIKEWHHIKNGNLKPDNVTVECTRVWWLCLKGCNTPGCTTPVHEWEATISKRLIGRGCPLCSNRGGRVCGCQTLAFKHPAIALEWHPTKNDMLEPHDVAAVSGKKVWWLCAKGCSTPGCSTSVHEWNTTISTRTRGRGCPICTNSGGYICGCKTLAFKHPDIASEWHPTKNTDVQPYNVAHGSEKKVWWLCTNGCSTPNCSTPVHEWETSISHRTGTKKGGCPICSNRGGHVCGCQTLAFKYPAIASEWHPTKNGKLQPTDVAAVAGKKVWWLCKKGCSTPECPTPVHEWEAYIYSRTGTAKPGCPLCAISGECVCGCKTLAFKYPNIASEWHPAKNGDLTPDIVASASNKKVWWLCRKGCSTPGCSTPVHEWEATISHRTLGQAGCLLCSNQGGYVCGCQTLAVKYPAIASEWHPIKNHSLQPQDVAALSGRKVWWLCKKGCSTLGCSTPVHEWEASISSRTGMNKSGCPVCSNKGEYVCGCQTLAFKYPAIASEWHPTKNEGIKPNSVAYGSDKTVWWLCSKGCSTPKCSTPVHEWQTSIYNRTGRDKQHGCPFCSSSRMCICECRTLASKYPDIASEWHPTKNGDLKPSDVSYASGKKVWWQCIKGTSSHVHEWETYINNRTGVGKRGCPICRINKAEALLLEILNNHPLVKEHWKKPIRCYDVFTDTTRNLIPDACGRLLNGKSFAIELDGPQHFKSVTFFNPEGSDFRDQLCRDLAKNRKLWNSGYSILRIAWEEYDSIENHVTTFIQQVFDSKQKLVEMIPREVYMDLMDRGRRLLGVVCVTGRI